MDCMWRQHNNHCLKCSGTCPFSCFEKRAIHCDEFIPEEYANLKMSAMDKHSAWADVKAKAEAIVAAGGVQIVEDSTAEVIALVMSGDVAGQFPVTDGGPYEVILSKKTWENKSNVGGWLQAYFCDCLWGQYHSGAPGRGFEGRLCSHAMAALIVADIRARKDFMDDRTAKVKYLGKCSECNKYDEIDAELELCSECKDKKAFEVVAKAIFANDDSELDILNDEEIDEIVDEMVIEERNGMNIARWNGHQAIFTKSAFDSLNNKIPTDCGYVSLEQNGDMWCLYPGEQFAEEFGMDYYDGGEFEEFYASDYEDAYDIAVRLLEDDWFVKVGSRATKSNKTATRAFSYSEIKELEDEVIDKPWLHNADRLKTREGLVDVF